MGNEEQLILNFESEKKEAVPKTPEAKAGSIDNQTKKGEFKTWLDITAKVYDEETDEVEWVEGKLVKKDKKIEEIE